MSVQGPAQEQKDAWRVKEGILLGINSILDFFVSKAAGLRSKFGSPGNVAALQVYLADEKHFVCRARRMSVQQSVTYLAQCVACAALTLVARQ